MKITKITGFYVKVVKGEMVDKQLEDAYCEGKVTDKVRAAKILAYQNGLKHADGVWAKSTKTKNVKNSNLKELWEDGEDA